jgi:hypothetical protein
LQCRAVLTDAVGDEDGDAEIVIPYRDLAEELDAQRLPLWARIGPPAGEQTVSG